MTTGVEHTENLNIVGNPQAPIVVVCDAPTIKAFDEGKVMTDAQMKLFMDHAKANRFEADEFLFMTPCPPVPESVLGSQKRENIFMNTYGEEFERTLRSFTDAKLIMYMGPRAGRQITRRPVKITKARGQVTDQGFQAPCLAMLSPSNVLTRPEVTETFATDFRIVSMIADAGWDSSILDQSATKCEYEYCLDLSGWLVNPPRSIGLDLESAGGQWYHPTCRILTVQLSRSEGKSIVVPLDVDWYNQDFEWFNSVDPPAPMLTYRNRAMLRRQLKELLENPMVAVTGSNLSGDLHKLRKIGIEVADWRHETQQLAFIEDENTFEKGLTNSVRRWVPSMAGYADVFERTVDFTHMERVKPADLLDYAGGDPDASRRLTKVLVKKGRADVRQWNCYQRIQMPALRTFNRMEEIGIRIDKQALRELGVVLEKKAKTLYEGLIKQVPASIKRLHAELGLKFSRDNFLVDILFTHPDGFNLVPTVFTKGTKNLPNPEDRKPSTSAKDHLPYFKHIPFVDKLIDYQKLAKMRSTYVGDEGGKLIPQRRKNVPPKYTEPSGFWQYISEDGRIHPAFFLHRTVTGRVASAYPNAQNFPKRGDLAEAFRKIFIPTPGYVFIEIDIRQAELRIAAWMANETNMLRIFREGGDIHEVTAAAIMGMRVDAFRMWKGSKESLPVKIKASLNVKIATYGDLYKLKRYQAKSVGFGFLFGMGWRKFKTYAKTDYGLDFTDQEAQNFRQIFFRLYPKLEEWHKSMRAFVNDHGYVRALHGALRHLPNINSGDEVVRGECERQAINSPVQRLGSCDLTLMGMIRFGRDADWERMRSVAMIHDSIIIEAKIEDAEEAMSASKFYMESPPLKQWFNLNPPIPIVSDVSMTSTNLSEMEEQEDIEAIPPPWYRADLDLAA